MTRKLASFVKWLGLLVGATVVAIALVHSLNSANYSSSDYSPSPGDESSLAEVQPSPEGVDESTFALQERYGRQWLHYATVSRGDNSFRQMFIAADAVDQIEAGQSLPDNTLILMETWYSPEAPGTVFIKQKLNETWQYGSFSPSRPNYQVSDRSGCHSCHAPFPETDFTLTKPLLEVALQRQELQTAYCELAGRSPCPPEDYFPDHG